MKKNIFYVIAICFVSMLSSCKKDGGWMHPVPSDPDPVKLAIADSVQTFRVTPSASTEADRMQFRGNHNDMQATGFYVAPNSTITVTVKVNAGTTGARLAIGTPFRDNIRPVRQYLDLQPGTQSFTVDQYGGLVYVIYTANNYTTTGEIELTFGDGFIPVPYFQKGKQHMVNGLRHWTHLRTLLQMWCFLPTVQLWWPTWMKLFFIRGRINS